MQVKNKKKKDDREYDMRKCNGSSGRGHRDISRELQSSHWTQRDTAKQLLHLTAVASTALTTWPPPAVTPIPKLNTIKMKMKNTRLY